MITCSDYLAMLETVPIQELSYGTPREHALQCRDCDRVTRVIVERERNMVHAYAMLDPASSPSLMASHAIDIARRRRIAFFYKVGLGLAAVATIALMIGTRRVAPRAVPALTSETFNLQCLSPQQAAVLIRQLEPQPDMSLRIRDPKLGVLSIDATPPQLQRIRAIIDRFDNSNQSRCAVEVVVPKVERVP